MSFNPCLFKSKRPLRLTKICFMFALKCQFFGIPVLPFTGCGKSFLRTAFFWGELIKALRGGGGNQVNSLKSQATLPKPSATSCRRLAFAVLVLKLTNLRNHDASCKSKKMLIFFQNISLNRFLVFRGNFSCVFP